MNFTIEVIKHTETLTIKFLTYDFHDIARCDLSILTSFEEERFTSFKSTKRKLEFYYSRILWRSFSKSTTIQYTTAGKPFIEKGSLSISHSKNIIAIGYSEDAVIGLDIEHFNPKIHTIHKKFISAKEAERFDLFDPIILTTIWSIKEALFKMTAIQALSFKNNFEILSIGTKNRAKISKSAFVQELVFEREIYPEFLLTYCFHPK